MKTQGEIQQTANGNFVYILNGSTSKPYPTLESVQARFPLAAIENNSEAEAKAIEEVSEQTQVDEPTKQSKKKKGKK